jgi:YrbI family 3-deoxy-D-manno-octulosonate 8-phosphate phosphatase
LNQVLTSFRTIGNPEIDISKIRSEAKEIRVLICDIDGTCTNGIKFFAEGERDLQWKCFSLKDIEAIKTWQKEGNFVFIITGDRQTPILQEFVDHAGIPQEHVFTEAENCKTGKLYEICQKHSFTMGEIAYIGDDMNDLGIMECLICENGMAACPHNASSFIQKINHIKRLKSNGGDGAVAEFIEEIHKINASGIRP